MASHLIISERFIIQHFTQIHALLEKFLQTGGRVTVYAENDKPTNSLLYSQNSAVYIILAHNYADRLHFINVPTLPANAHFDMRYFIRHSKSNEKDYFLSERLVQGTPGAITQYFYTDVTNLNLITKVIAYLTDKHLPPLFPIPKPIQPNGTFYFKTPNETSNEKLTLLNLDLLEAKRRNDKGHFSFFNCSLVAKYNALPDSDGLEVKNENGLLFENSILSQLRPSIEFFIKDYCGSMGSGRIKEFSLIEILNNLVSTISKNDKRLLLSILLTTEISSKKWKDQREQYNELIENILKSLPLEDCLDIVLHYCSWDQAKLRIKEVFFKLGLIITDDLESKQDESAAQPLAQQVNIDYNATITRFISNDIYYQSINDVLPNLPIDRLANIGLIIINFSQDFITNSKGQAWQYLEKALDALSTIVTQLANEEEITLLLHALPTLLELLNRDKYNSRTEYASLRILLALNKYFDLVANDDKKYLVNFILKEDKYFNSDYTALLLNTALQVQDLAYQAKLIKRLEKLSCEQHKTTMASYYIDQTKSILTSCSLILAYHHEIDKNIHETDLPDDLNNIIKSYLRP